MSEQYYSRYYLVPKRLGSGIHPILDRHALNKYLRKYKFRMLTQASLLRLVQQNDWFTSINAENAISSTGHNLSGIFSGKSVQFRLCLRSLGLMASAILKVHLCGLHMREFRALGGLMQAGSPSSWHKDSAGHGLHPLKEVGHYGCKPVGWGRILEGRSVRGHWSVDLQRSHIIFWKCQRCSSP